MSRLRDKYVKQYKTEETAPTPETQNPGVRARNTGSIILDDIDSCVVKYAQCCNPLPGDEIVGFITRGHGISIHNKNCVNYRAAMKRNDPAEAERWVNVQWAATPQAAMQTGIEVIATDRVGLVYDITGVLMESKIPIIHSASRNLKNGNALFEAAITIAGTEQLRNLMDKIRHVKGVISVERAAVKTEKNG